MPFVQRADIFEISLRISVEFCVVKEMHSGYGRKSLNIEGKEFECIENLINLS